MSIIYKRFDGSGLSGMLVAAQVIAEESVEKALCGKHYKHNIRCLWLMCEVLSQLVIRKGTTPDKKLQVYSELESHPDIVFFVIQAF